MKAADSHRVRHFFQYLGLGLVTLVLLFPLVLALSVALQGETVNPGIFPGWSQLDPGVFLRAFQTEPLLGRWILNSFVVSCAVTLGQVLTSALAAFALVHLRFRGKVPLFFFFIASLMIPWEATIIPNYITIASLEWKDSYTVLIVPFLASGFGIFLLRQSFKTIPHELWESAMMEGCGRIRYLFTFLLPLARPALATLAIYTFIGTWNQFYWPLLVIDDPAWRTTQVGISAFRASEISSYNLQMAATLIVVAPTLILLFLGQKQLVKGLTSGAVKS